MPLSAARAMNSGSDTSISAITGAVGVLHDLVDQVERVLVVVVQLHKRDIRLVVRDLSRHLGDADRPSDHGVPEL